METKVTSTDMISIMNTCAMDYAALLKKKNDMMFELLELDSIIKAKRKEDIENLTRAYVTAMMGAYQTSMEELNENLTRSIQDFSGDAWTTTSASVDDQVGETSPAEIKDATLSIPESTEAETLPMMDDFFPNAQEDKNGLVKKGLPSMDELFSNGAESITTEDEKKIESKSGSIFDTAALQEPYNPSTEEENNKVQVVKTSDQEEDGLPSMDELLSVSSIKEPVAKNNRSLPSMDELLSGEPLTRIMNMGNYDPKGTAYRQNNRICHADGIVPTFTASGTTYTYIPRKS